MRIGDLDISSKEQMVGRNELQLTYCIYNHEDIIHNNKVGKFLSKVNFELFLDNINKIKTDNLKEGTETRFVIDFGHLPNLIDTKDLVDNSIRTIISQMYIDFMFDVSQINNTDSMNILQANIYQVKQLHLSRRINEFNLDQLDKALGNRDKDKNTDDIRYNIFGHFGLVFNNMPQTPLFKREEFIVLKDNRLSIDLALGCIKEVEKAHRKVLTTYPMQY